MSQGIVEKQNTSRIRTKDWADLEEMHAANTLDIEFIADVLKEYLGEEDERLDKLNDLAGRVGCSLRAG